MSECRGCGKATRDQAYACDDCADELGRALSEVPWLEIELEVTISRQKGAVYDGSNTAGAETPTPVHWAAAEARTHLRGMLVSWIKLCAEEGVRSSDSRPGLPADTLTDMARWLLWRVDGLALHEAGAEAVEELTSAVAHCHRFIDIRPERHYVGPCPACERDMYAVKVEAGITCQGCGESHSVTDLREWMNKQIGGRLVTAREGATLLSRYGLETKQGTIDKWRERKRLTELGHTTAGHRVYLWEELLTLAQHAATRMGA